MGAPTRGWGPADPRHGPLRAAAAWSCVRIDGGEFMAQFCGIQRGRIHGAEVGLLFWCLFFPVFTESKQLKPVFRKLWGINFRK